MTRRTRPLPARPAFEDRRLIKSFGRGRSSEPAPAEGIFRIAVEYQSVLTVIGVHSAGPAQAHEIERTAYRVIRVSQCPVLAIPSPSRKGFHAVKKKGEAWRENISLLPSPI